MHVFKTLLPGSEEALARKEESGSFLSQAEQYFEAILDAWEIVMSRGRLEAILDAQQQGNRGVPRQTRRRVESMYGGTLAYAERVTGPSFCLT